MRKPKKKRIILNPKFVKAIMAEFETSYATVYQSLNFTRGGELAANIRKAARDRYNGKIEELYIRPITDEDLE